VPVSEARLRSQIEDQSDILSLLRGLIAHKWLILGATLAGGLLVGLWTMRQPKIYQGTCTLEYDPSPPRPLGSEIEEVAGAAVNFWQTQEWYETQNRIIASRGVAEKVVNDLGLHQNAAFHQIPKQDRKRWKGATVEHTAQMLQRRLSVEQIRDTRLVEIQVEDIDPGRAALLANTVAKAYIDKSMEDRLGSTVSALDWLSQQLDTQRQELQATENALHDFKRSHDVLSLSLEDRQNIISQDLERYSESLTQARTKRIELTSRLNQLRAAYDEDPLKVNIATFTQHPIIAEQRNAYREKMAQRKALSVKYGESHPEMQALQEELDIIRGQMKREVDGMIRSAESELREVQETEGGLRGAAKDTHEAGLTLNKQEIQYNALKRQQENQSKLYSMLLERTTQTDLTRMLHVSNVRMIDNALAPIRAIRPRIPINLAFGLLSGMIFGIGLSFLLIKLDRTIRSVEDLEALGLTVLGVVPKLEQSSAGLRLIKGMPKADSPEAQYNRNLIVHTQPMSAAAECCRTIRTNLTFTAASKPFHTLAVTSAGPLEGKTTVSINLAITMAQAGKRVLLVDTDLRRPRIHSAFDISSAVGVTSVLVGEQRISDAVQNTEVPNLFVLPSGPIPPNPSELLGSAAFRRFLEEVTTMFDRVIFDSPPLGAVTDGAVIAPQVDGTIVVMRANKTTRDAARTALKRLTDIEAHLAGGVLNGVDLHSKRYGGYDYGSYEYRASILPEKPRDSSTNAA
jgi:succinoglycan biosynthesis transport protein ExoP